MSSCEKGNLRLDRSVSAPADASASVGGVGFVKSGCRCSKIRCISLVYALCVNHGRGSLAGVRDPAPPPPTKLSRGAGGYKFRSRSRCVTGPRKWSRKLQPSARGGEAWRLGFPMPSNSTAEAEYSHDSVHLNSPTPSAAADARQRFHYYRHSPLSMAITSGGQRHNALTSPCMQIAPASFQHDERHLTSNFAPEKKTWPAGRSSNEKKNTVIDLLPRRRGNQASRIIRSSC